MLIIKEVIDEILYYEKIMIEKNMMEVVFDDDIILNEKFENIFLGTML
jgi:hypothetical protein